MRIPHDLSRERGWLSLNANFFFTNKLQRERSILRQSACSLYVVNVYLLHFIFLACQKCYLLLKCDAFICVHTYLFFMEFKLSIDGLQMINSI